MAHHGDDFLAIHFIEAYEPLTLLLRMFVDKKEKKIGA